MTYCPEITASAYIKRGLIYSPGLYFYCTSIIFSKQNKSNFIPPIYFHNTFKYSHNPVNVHIFFLIINRKTCIKLKKAVPSYVEETTRCACFFPGCLVTIQKISAAIFVLMLQLKSAWEPPPPAPPPPPPCPPPSLLLLFLLLLLLFPFPTPPTHRSP